MRQAEDRVWAAITESAKRRFDYDGFKNRLSETGDERVADYILFQIIEGFAEERSLAEIMLSVLEDLEMFSYAISEDDLSEILADKPEILRAEVYAARVALVGFTQEISASELLTKICRILSQEMP